MVGRQRLSKGRIVVTLLIYPLLLILIGMGAITHPERLWWLVGGVCLGSGLGVVGLKKTRFEPTPEGLFYTPHAHLGIALSLLFVARVVYRMIQVYAVSQSGAQGMNSFGNSSLTLSVFGLLAGYYVTYAVGLARWRSQLVQAKREREAGRLPTARTE